MYNVCICENEPTILRGLTDSIPWSEIGYNLIGSFDSDIPASEQLRQGMLDVVICDIDCNGLDLAQHIYSEHLNAKIILLGSETAQNLLRNALRFQAADFLFKPLNIQEFISSLSRIKRWLDQEQLVRTNGFHVLRMLNLLQTAFDENHLSPIFIFTLSCHGNVPSQQALITLIRNALVAVDTSKLIIYWREVNQFILCIQTTKEAQSIHNDILLLLSQIEHAFEISFHLSVPLAVLQNFSSSTAPCPESILNQDIVTQAEAFITRNLDKKITIDMISKNIHVNPSYLSRAFKKKTGVTFSDYLLQTRIDHAKKLLINTNKYVYEVCDEVGIPNYQYFYLCFRKMTGFSPNEFRNAMCTESMATKEDLK